MKKKILITGGAGFIGTNLALRLAKNYKVYSLDNFYKNESLKNLDKLTANGVEIIKGDIRNLEFIEKIVQKEEFHTIFHFAAQVAMTKSILDPQLDFEINVQGTLNLLNAIKNSSSDTKFINLSSNKVYGDLSWDKLVENPTRYTSLHYKEGYGEETKLDFLSPYGCSKGSAEQYVIDYSKTFGLQTMSLRLSTIFGPNQYFTIDQGWVGWFINQYLNVKKNNKHIVDIQGNGKQVRDILFIDDLTALFELILEKNLREMKTNYFNVGGGVKNSLSILELLNLLQDHFNSKIDININEKNWRVSDQKFYISKLDNIKHEFGWEPEMKIKEKVYEYLNWIESNQILTNDKRKSL